MAPELEGSTESGFSWLDTVNISSLASNQPGSYVLLMFLDRAVLLRAGKLPQRIYPAGWYAYCGSALRGLRGRLGRYVKSGRTRHWHIDYLLDHAAVRGAYIVENPERIECRLAEAMAEKLDNIPGFGCSDCRCRSHLFHGRNEECMRAAITFTLPGRFNKEI